MTDTEYWELIQLGEEEIPANWCTESWQVRLNINVYTISSATNLGIG